MFQIEEEIVTRYKAALIALVEILLILIPSIVCANPVTIYVPDNYLTIQEAVDVANPSDTIIVGDGIYIENVNVNKPNLTITSENGPEVTVVEAANSNDHVFEVVANYVIIEGFTVKGATFSLCGGIYLDADYCKIVSNISSENFIGINLRPNSKSNTIYFNNFTDNTWNWNMLNAYPAPNVNNWSSDEKITYTYDGYNYTNYMGNYWDDYIGSDIDGDGIGDTSYVVDRDNDNYPLIEPFENYESGVESWSFDSDFQYNLDDNYATVEGTGHLQGTATLYDVNLSIEAEFTFNGPPAAVIPELYLIATDGLDRELAQQLVDPRYFSYSQTGPNTYQFSGFIPDVVTPINNGHYEVSILIPYGSGKYPFFLNTDSLINKHYFPLIRSNIKLSIPVYAPVFQKAHEGTTLTYIIRVTNEGDTEDTINLSVSDQSISEDQARWWDVHLTSPSVTLLPGESQDISIEVTIKEKGSNEITIRGQSSNANTLPTEVSVEAATTIWDATLFGAELQFSADPCEEHTLVFQAPACAKITREFLQLVRGTRFTEIVFDPEQPGDLENSYVHVADTVNGNVIVEITLPIKFAQHSDEVHVTGFDLGVDSYKFANTHITQGYYSKKYDEGYCYGMAETSILYFEGLLPTPYNKQTYELSQEQEETMKNIALYQGRLKNPLNSFAINTEDDEDDYSCLENNISNGHPVMIILGARTQQGKAKHAVVAYKVIKDSGANRSYISIYDPTFSYKAALGSLLPAFPIIVYDANTKGFLPYCDGQHQYTMFDVLEADLLNMAGRLGSTALGHVMEAKTVAEDWVTDKVTLLRDRILMIIKCPVIVEVVDEYDRIIDSQGMNEIPGAYFTLDGEEKVFYLPSNLTYSVRTEAYDFGDFGLGAAFSVENWGASGTTFDAVSVGPDSVAEYSIQSGVPNDSLILDFDRDGIFEQVLAGAVFETYQTKVTYNGDLSGYRSRTAKLRATLSMGNGQPLINETITFSLGTQAVEATTDTSGTATATLLINQDPGRCAIDVQFAGDSYYLPSSVTEIFQVFPLGDFNRDWAINFFDFIGFGKEWLANCSHPNWCQGADMNYDGSVNFVDFTTVAENWLWEKIYADLDMDWDVDFVDYALFASHRRDADCKQPDWCSGVDLNKMER